MTDYDEHGVFQVESDTKPGKFYEVDLRVFTCTCTFGKIQAPKYEVDDPRRICKHLARVMLKHGIPEEFEGCEERIQRAAHPRPARDTSKDVRIEEISVVSRIKEGALLHLAATARNIRIEAELSVEDGSANVDIDGCMNYRYDPIGPNPAFYSEYQFLKRAVLEWLAAEFSEVAEYEE